MSEEKKGKHKEKFSEKLKKYLDPLFQGILGKSKNLEEDLYFRDEWEVAIFALYTHLAIKEIIESVRAIDDLPTKFDPCKGEPNIIGYLQPESEEDRKFLKNIISDAMNKSDKLRILKKEELKEEEGDREKLSEIFKEAGEKINRNPLLSSYCTQLAKCVYWKKFYKLLKGEMSGNNILELGGNTCIRFEKNFEEKDKDKFKLRRRVTSEERNILQYIIEVKKDKYSYHIVEFDEYPNLYLLEKQYKKYLTTSEERSILQDIIKKEKELPKYPIVWAPQFGENFKTKYGDLWITKEVIEKGVLEYMMTLGGAYLLTQEGEWFWSEARDKKFKFFIQHPFQEKVVVEVLNHQNYAYPSEMIRNWKKWKAEIGSKDRFIWIRESVQPVVNKIKITKEVANALKKHYENIGVKIEEGFKEGLEKLADEGKGVILFFQIHEQFVRTPTTAILIIILEKNEKANENSSRLFQITEKFAERQERLKEVLEGLKSGEIKINGEYKELWKGDNDFEWSLSDPTKWINKGVLGIIWRELKCCYALLKIINYYLTSERYKEKLTRRMREDLRMSKEEIYDFLEFEYLNWLKEAVTTIKNNKSRIEEHVGNGYVQEFLNETKKVLESLMEVAELENLKKKIGEILKIISKA